MKVSLALLLLLVYCSTSSTVADLEGTWFPMGPAAIEDAQTYGPNNERVEASGRATVIAVNPENPQDCWLGTATGGVWYSTNAGTPGMNWRPMTDYQLSLATGALLLDQCSAERCNQVYIGTGENNIRRHTYYGVGIIKGAWSGVEFPSYSFQTYGTSDVAFTGGAINNIIFDDDDLVVTVSEGRSSSASQSTIRAPEPQAGYGVHRTSDDGATWQLVAPSPGGALPTDLVKSPTNGELFAGFMGQGICKLSGGEWCPLHPGVTVPDGCTAPVGTGLPDASSDPFDHVEIEWSPANNDVVYMALGRCPSETSDSCVPDFYRSNDGGSSWVLLAATPDSGSILSYTRYTHALRAHPVDEDIIFYGGLELWRSTNGGASFQNTGTGSIHPDHQDIVYADPNGDTELLYSANDGGFYFSDNSGSNWLSGNYDLQTVQFYSIAADTEQEGGSNIDTDVVIGGAQDNGINMFSGSRKWDHVLDSDGGDTAIEDGKKMIGSMYKLSPYRTTTGGGLGDWDSYGGGQLSGEASAFYPPYLQHPITKDYYFATDRLHSRTPGDPTWIQISPVFDPSATEYPLIETKNVISSVGLSRSNPNRIYVGHYNGAIWRTTGAGPCSGFECWDEVGGPNIGGDNLPSAVVSSIDVDPTNPDRVYVTYSGFDLAGGNNVYTSGTGGTGAWQQISDGLPNLPANVIKIDPENPTQLWLGSDRGIYMKDGDSDWEKFGRSSRMPNVPVYDLAIDKFRGRVYAGTFGRGAYVLTNNPAIYTYEGWMDGEIWDILLYGKGFVDSFTIDSCTVDILLQNGETCASGETDSYSTAIVKIGGDGSLVTDNQFIWSNRPVIAACFNGNCVGDTDIEDCLADPDNLISSVKVTCGGQEAFASVSEDCPQQDNPPSTIFAADGEGGRRRRLLEGEVASFDVIVTLASTSASNGGDRALCGVRVDYHVGQDSVAIGEAIVKAINSSSSCRDAGVEALHPVFRPPKRPRGEDDSELIGEVLVQAPDLKGGQLMLAFRGAPGQYPGLCFAVRSLGLPALKTLFMLQKRITTSAGGAAGGTIAFRQRSGQGTCTQTIVTAPNDSASEIAQKIGAAFMTVVEPGTNECESRQNAYDMIAENDILLSVSSKGLSVCVEDSGVGIQVGPMELDLDLVSLSPNARCKNVTVSAGADCTAKNADVNDGSSDPEDGLDVQLSYEPEGPYKLGETHVTLTVTDNDGMSSFCDATVTVEDITPPKIVSLWPSCLWPPNHKFLCKSGFGVEVTDNCPGAIVTVAEQCFSSQPEDSTGDGNFEPDCIIGSPADKSVICVRAERDGKDKAGRVYTLFIKATDDAGNDAKIQVEVDVPKKKDNARNCKKASWKKRAKNAAKKKEARKKTTIRKHHKKNTKKGKGKNHKGKKGQK